MNKKLILHFDQHNTIQVANTIPGREKTVEQGLNTFLSSTFWGVENENGEWKCISNEPHIKRPMHEPKASTYFKYLEKKIVNVPSDRPLLKKQTSNFINTKHGEQFKHFYKQYLNHMIFDQINDTLPQDDIKKIGNLLRAGDPNDKSYYHLIFPEFFDLICRLQKDERNFTIILRTNGIESNNFFDSITGILDGKHPLFPDIKPIQINRNIGLLKREDGDIVKFEMEGITYDNERSIYDKLNSLTGIFFNFYFN
jgi:hypothetical protein